MTGSIKVIEKFKKNNTIFNQKIPLVATASSQTHEHVATVLHEGLTSTVEFRHTFLESSFFLHGKKLISKLIWILILANGPIFLLTVLPYPRPTYQSSLQKRFERFELS